MYYILKASCLSGCTETLKASEHCNPFLKCTECCTIPGVIETLEHEMAALCLLDGTPLCIYEPVSIAGW